MSIPETFLDSSRSRRSAWFAGERINQSAIARAVGIEASYLSRILAGNRLPTVPFLRTIARALGMTMEELMEAIDDRKRLLKRRARTSATRSASV